MGTSLISKERGWLWMYVIFPFRTCFPQVKAKSEELIDRHMSGYIKVLSDVRRR